MLTKSSRSAQATCDKIWTGHSTNYKQSKVLDYLGMKIEYWKKEK